MVISKNNKPELEKIESPFYQLWVLLNTYRGSVPLERDLGIDPRLVDRPQTKIQAAIQAELQNQINKYIPKLRLKNVQTKLSNTGILDILCEVELR